MFLDGEELCIHRPFLADGAFVASVVELLWLQQIWCRSFWIRIDCSASGTVGAIRQKNGLLPNLEEPRDREQRGERHEHRNGGAFSAPLVPFA